MQWVIEGFLHQNAAHEDSDALARQLMIVDAVDARLCERTSAASTAALAGRYFQPPPGSGP